MSLGRLGGVYALLHAGHEVADLILQTDDQAVDKGEDGWKGRLACARHVATLTATQGVFLAFGAWVSGERLSVRRVAAGLALNAVSHYAADRRDNGVLPKVVAWPKASGKAVFYRMGDPDAAPCGTGAYGIDKAWHLGWLVPVAAVIAG